MSKVLLCVNLFKKINFFQKAFTIFNKSDLLSLNGDLFVIITK